MCKTFLVADIGGTNCRISCFNLNNDNLSEKVKQEYLTAEIVDFPDLLSKILKHEFFSSQIYDAVVVAAAGPVSKDGICTPPNIDWSLSLADLKNAFGNTPVYLINDFLAQSYAVLTPLIKNGTLVKEGNLQNTGMIGVIGPGTGLGKSFVAVGGSNKTFGFPSEGGHTAFPAVTKEEFSFMEFVKAKENSNYVTYEHVTSGRVLSYLYEFHYGEKLSVEEVGKKLKSQNLELLINDYSRYLGRACRDFALEILAEGGMYIAGGVLAKSPEILNNEIFRLEFENSPTQSKLLESIRVVNFSSNDSGLWGAAKFASLS